MASVFKRSDRDPRYWWYKHKDEHGFWVRKKGLSDKRETQRLADKLEADAALRRAGLIDPLLDRLAGHARRPLGEHIEEYYRHLRDKGSTAKHCWQTRAYLDETADALVWTNIRQIDALKIQRWLTDERAARDWSARTVNARVKAWKSFSGWLARHGRLAADPLGTLTTLNEHEDRRRIRRVLSQTELARLIEIAEKGPTRGGISGPDRAMLIRVMAFTGLRLREAASLRPESFKLGFIDGPVVELEARSSKRRRQDRVPLIDALAGSLRPWLAKRAPGAPVWILPWHPEKVLQADLRAAKIPIETTEGVIDWHSFRHGLATTLARKGVPPKATQVIMRHASITQTMDVYAHVTMEDARREMERALNRSRRGGNSRRRRSG